MAPFSDSKSVTAIALNYSNISSDNSNNQMAPLGPQDIYGDASRIENSSSSTPCHSLSPQKHLKKTATNQASRQISRKSDCDGATEVMKDVSDKDENENEFEKMSEMYMEQPKRASSDAKTLKVEAKRISRCLSSNETRAFQQQQHDHEKLKALLQDKRLTNVKGTKEAATHVILQDPSPPIGNNAYQSSLEQANINPSKNITNKVSTRPSSSSQQATTDNIKFKGTNTDGSSKIASNNNRKSSTSGSQQQHQKQMFSLKQLTINPKNLTKKRCSLQAGTSSGNQDEQISVNRVFPKLFDCSQNINHSQSLASNEGQERANFSSSGSSCNELATNLDKLTLPVKRKNSRQKQDNHTTGDSGNDDEPNQFDDGLEGNKENSLFLNEPNDLSDEHFSDDGDDDDDDDDDDEDDEDDDDDFDDDLESDSELYNDNKEGNSSDEDQMKQRQATKSNGSLKVKESSKQGRKRRSERVQQRRLFRRSSCCNCEQLINKIDCDGLPVTDVDLVSYKDLCQMEQQAHHIRTSGMRQHLDTTNCASTLSRANYGWQSGSIRRSSLQEESGAYYELCTSGEEQLIRQKYVWFPPSLKQLHLVDKFFENFSKDKIPFALQSHLSSASIGTNTEQDQQASSQPLSSQDGTTKVGPIPSKSGVPSLLASSSYRDEQISAQLPRQDISLDYCSYHMSDSSRAAYMQFVDKRNSQALDVGNVVLIKLNSFSQKPTTTSTQTHSNFSSGWQTPTSNNKLAQRRVSTLSQSAVALLSLNQVGQHEQLGQHGSSCSSGAQRCRRCLVRFEDKQLAVMAPNFVIGSTSIYRPSVIPLTSVVIEGQTTPSTATPPIQTKLRDKQSEDQDRNSSSAVAASNVALYHPNCFTCSTCKEFLVDLVYCLRDNKLYCVRHYGESLRPRCSWCQELIFSDEYLKAMNESFHVDHFLCRHCDTNLAGQRYVLKEEKPFCIQCYERNFANICEDCQKPIGIDSRDLSYKDRHWHDTCFSCNKCQQSLIDKPFGSKTDKVYCADCYDNTFATRCDGCKNPFRAGSKKMEYRGKQWHDSCFCCCVCQNTIGSNSFIPKNEEIYCIKCYEDKFATKCIKCKQVIVSGGVTFRNEPWHRDCFNCCNCSKSLAGQRFTTRDVKNETVKNTNKTNQPHNAYCIDCYGELFAKKCFACTQAITGLGGTRFVTFEDRSWHNDCFLCNDCNTSLVGKGFITDGPDTILCSDCARAKLR